jgi:hypothetical protein
MNTFISEIDEAELVARMLEAAAGIERPPGMSAMQALAIANDEMVAIMRRAAHAAMDYWRECIQRAQVPS